MKHYYFASYVKIPCQNVHVKVKQTAIYTYSEVKSETAAILL